MILCKAIDKIKDKKGITVGYVLADTNGKKVRVNSKDIKKSIKEGKIEVSNLKITSDGRLMFNKNTPNHLNNTLTNFYKKQLLDVVQRICKATDFG